MERPPTIQITGECFHRLRVNDLGLFRIHCHGQRGVIQAKVFSTDQHFPFRLSTSFSLQDLSVGDRIDISQTISFQLQDPYEQFLHFSAPIFLRSLNLLLTARLRLNPDRIRNVTLTKENGLLIAF